MRKLFSLPFILPKRLGLPGRSAVAAGLSQRLGGVATSEAALTLTCYMALTQAVKSWLPQRAWA